MPLDSVRNPLLDFGEGPLRFDAVDPAHVRAAVDAVIAACGEAVERVAAQDPATATWDTVVEPLDEATDRLARAWGAVAHLNAVADSAALREQYNAALPAVTAFWTALAQHAGLYRIYRALAARPDFPHWPAARRRVIDNELRDFRLGGAELDPAGQSRLREIRERQSLLSTRFNENVLDATDAFALDLDDPSRLGGVPDEVRAMYREAAQAAGRAGWRITLHQPSYRPALAYADDRALRETLYRAHATRASELGPASWDNTANILELLRLRREQARLLGYADYAQLSLVPKMADSTGTVMDFLHDLGARARPRAQADMLELREFAAAELALPELQAWDVPYASERLRLARYAYSEHELKAYFPRQAVLRGLFEVIGRLFGVKVCEDAAPVWHPDVSFHRIEATDGRLVGQIYLDLHARAQKQGGAWQDDARVRRRRAAGVQTPVSYVVCNFSPAVGGRPALFTHDEVLTLFHEFGHALHHLLTQVDEASISGIRGVEWDAVELPSQFMENFAWDWEVLQRITAHVDSGAPLPRPLFERMIAARNFQSGMAMVRQLEFALFDLRVHAELDPEGADGAALQALLDAVRREVAVVFPPPEHRGAHAFSHIFAGGYAAGYYSYKWAEVLSADCFSAFEERAGVLDPELGRRFRDEILATGGSRPALESFVAFRGRKPSIDALLRHQGIAP